LASRDFLQPWEPRWPKDHLSRGAFKRRIRWATTEADAGRAFAFLLVDIQDETLIGGITVSNIRRGPSRSASLGYWVGEAHARKGYMRDAVECVAGFAFDTLELVRLEAACLENNTASRALLERCGFKAEGVVRGYLEVNGTVRDHVLYARISDELPQEGPTS
jgi:ribosomal-protein-alanine N-acetyltransferase